MIPLQIHFAIMYYHYYYFYASSKKCMFVFILISPLSHGCGIETVLFKK
jgi:hypothetical protein